ncbi:MAG: alpha/beta fold hydrolase [Solirubrobacteraceae bacterium]
MTLARRVALTTALMATYLAAVFASAAQAAPPAPRMHLDNQFHIRTACFSVVNPHGTHSVLYGQWFIDGASYSTRTPTIVLVHGLASSTKDWDFSHTWSVARALASAGYEVVSYDQLGFAKSPYRAGSGGTLTTAAQRGLLHQVVGQIKSGTYTLTTRSNCSKPSDSHPLHSDKVVVVGHSAGGLVTAGYPGRYHDVNAMIQADISASKPTTPAPGGGFDPQPGHVDYFQFFRTRQDCETFNAFAPGVVRYVLNVACAPPFVLTPVGELTGLDQAYADNATYIPKIGPRIPVLLTSGAQDTTDPPNAADQDYAYYRSHCHCSVARYVVPNTGHLFMAHKSLPSWIQHVVTWLSAHGVKPGVVLPADLRDGRRGPRALAVKVVPKQLQKFPLHFEVKGSVLLWSGMNPAQWCGGFVDVQVGATTEKPATGRAPVHRNCTFSENIRVTGKPQVGKARFLRLRFRFAGDAALHGGATKTFLYRLPSA